MRLNSDISVGGKSPFLIIAGHCVVENRGQVFKVAKLLKKLGINVLRGGAYKPRTSPHSFQGLGDEGLKLLSEVKRETGLITVTEVMSPEHVGKVSEVVDILQIGARNMQNFDLLKEVGRSKRPVILKRGLSATIEKWLASAEYILLEGNPDVILCERGIRTFETLTRNTSDLSVIPLTKSLSHLPVIFDPSHATGKRSLVSPMALASIVVGADGVMIEVHPEPEQALSDGQQSLNLKEFERLYKKLVELESFVKRVC
ncbi:MAG: 3-deoxy-7-phosphoheptulonate synthase [Thermodesulfovibrionales bacterium]